MKSLIAVASTLAVLITLGRIDPNMTIGEFVETYGPASVVVREYDEEDVEEEDRPAMVVIEDESSEEPPEESEEVEALEESEGPDEEADEEADLYEFYSEEDVHEIAAVIHGEANGRDWTQKAAVAWCVLNRADAWGESIHEVVNESGSFRKAKPETEDVIIARDVLNRWSSEKRGFEDSGRVLPREYKFFSGNGEVNRFREELDSTEHYDWSLESPYNP